MTFTATGIGMIVLSLFLIFIGFFWGTMFTWKSMANWMKTKAPSKDVKNFGESLIAQNNSFTEIFKILINYFRF